MSGILRQIGLGLGLACGLSACSGSFNPVRDAAVATGIGAKPSEAPAFVASSRPANLDYLPVGTAPNPRAGTAKPQAALKSNEAQLDALRTANEARAAEARAAGATPPPAPPRLDPPLPD